MKKILFFILGFVLLIGLAIWSPWDHVATSQLKTSVDDYQVGSLIFTSLAGEVEVFIDGESQGVAKIGSEPLKVNAVPKGSRKVKLQRKTEALGFYHVIEKEVVFQEGIGVVMAYEVGPTKETSMGYTLFATTIPEQVTTNQNADLTISTNVEGVDISVDDEVVGKTPINTQKILTTNNHQMTFSKDGYLPLEFELFPNDQNQRSKFSGANVTVIVDLYKIPLS